MKVLINARLLNLDHIEGVGRYALEVIQRWVRDHPDDEYHLIYDRKIEHCRIEGDNVYHHRYGLPSRIPLLWRLWFGHSLRRAIRDIQPDVVFSPESHMCWRTDVPTVITTHDLAFARYPEYNKPSHNRYYEKYFPLYHHHASHVITVSHYSKKDICDYYGLSDEKVSVVYNGVSDQYQPVNVNRSKLPTTEPYFLYVGSIHPRKNVDGVIKAFELMKQTHGLSHRLILCGRMAWRYDGVQQLIDQSEYSGDIIQLDYYEGDMNALLNGVTALCYLSRFEGFGLPPVEAMAAGCPVISSDKTAIPEIVGDAAMLADPDDLTTVVKMMYDLASDSDLRDNLIQKGVNQARKYNWEASAKAIYDKLAEVSNWVDNHV